MKHLLDTSSLSRADAIGLLDIAEEMTQLSAREVKKLPVLRGRTVVNLFFEDSTRTRLSFEAAAKRLSADVLNFSAKGSSVSKGESLQDTVQTISAMGADAIVVRHSAAGTAQRLADTGWIDVPVVNAGDGTHEHPTQALLDAFTLRRALAGVPASGAVAEGPRGKGLDGASVAIVGDILHSRVARSNVHLLDRLGADVHLVAPPTLLPWGAETWPVTIHYDLDSAIGAVDFDAVMMLRVQYERMHESFFPNAREYARLWGLSEARLQRLGDTFIMHPGPMNRGFEISAAAADSPRALILDQVENGVSVRMAVLHRLLTGQEETID
ncbi:aspartate carbamoyltransferase catalytic subunit [Brevibacterium casei]|uniref:aspartate carbamoyltransferase catalytic subunit n=1 Tax=Brevibacterium casei TaxID=33889 RepID=UPI00246949E5|nr:aspartate carbamoyltransferase catalytic subunit [Brevibacterium casei]MDH5148538.1 aspartate carbamoyltransferase catalytic subunit [Brevibacterium casei]